MPLLPDPHDHTIDLLIGDEFADDPIITFGANLIERYRVSLAALEREGLDGWNLATLKLGIYPGHAADLLMRIHAYMKGAGEDNETRRATLDDRKGQMGMSRFVNEWQRGWDERHAKKENKLWASSSHGFCCGCRRRSS